MAWEYKYWDLKRILRYLPKDYRALYNARQIVMSSSYGVDNAISQVPEKFKSNTIYLLRNLRLVILVNFS